MYLFISKFLVIYSPICFSNYLDEILYYYYFLINFKLILSFLTKIFAISLLKTKELLTKKKA